MAFALPAREAAKLDAVKATPIGRGMARAAGVNAGWRIDDTERWLTDWPLPATFKWNGTRAYPSYKLVAKDKEGRLKGYGFWLRTAGPYHPALRGLFMLCHSTLAALRPGIDPMPSGEQLAALLLKQQRPPEDLPWSEEDKATIAPGALNPAENVPSPSEPSANPTATERQPRRMPTLSQT